MAKSCSGFFRTGDYPGFLIFISFVFTYFLISGRIPGSQDPRILDPRIPPPGCRSERFGYKNRVGAVRGCRGCSGLFGGTLLSSGADRSVFEHFVFRSVERRHFRGRERCWAPCVPERPNPTFAEHGRGSRTGSAFRPAVAKCCFP